MSVRALRRGTMAGRGAAPAFTLTGVSLLTEAASTSNLTTYTTASVTPTSNRLVLVWVMSSGATAAPSSVTGNGITYSLVRNQVETFGTGSCSLYAGSSATPSAGTIDITFGAGRTGCAWRIEEWEGSSTPAVRQSTSAESSSVDGDTSHVVTLGSAPAAGSAVDAGFAVRNSNALAGTDPDFTVGTNLTYSSPAMRIMTEYDLTPTDSGATCTSASATYWAGIAAEIGAP